MARSAAHVSVVQKGLPVPATRITTRCFSRCRQRSPPNERLGDRPDFDRGHDPGVDPQVEQRFLERQPVHDRRQHSHVISGGLVDVRRLGELGPPHNVAPPDHDGQLRARFPCRLDLGSDKPKLRGIDPLAARGTEGLATELEKDAAVLGGGRVGHGLSGCGGFVGPA